MQSRSNAEIRPSQNRSSPKENRTYVLFDIDIWFEVNQQSYCIEIKIGKAKVQDAYQLQMYWDGLVVEGKEIKEAHLVAGEFSGNVRLAVQKINEKKDLKNNPYNLICKVASDFGFD